MIDNIANELMIASRVMKTNVVSTIAQDIGYRPLLIISALYRAAEMGKFTYNKKSDTITLSEGVDLQNLQLTEGMTELREIVEQFMHYQNSKEETDMSTDELLIFLGGVPELHLNMILFSSKKLATYEIADPKDKESVYTFITLTENLDKRWGQKQFNTKKSKARKFADNAIKEGKKNTPSKKG